MAPPWPFDEDAAERPVVPRRAAEPMPARETAWGASGTPAGPWLDPARVGSFHAWLHTRRRRRFLAAGLFVLALGILAAVWLVTGVALGASAIPAPAPGFAGLALLALVVLALLLTAGCALGNVAALALAWLAGLGGMLVALNDALLAVAAGPGTAVLVALLGVVGLFTVLVATLGLASWRGRRVEARILGAPSARRRALL